MAATAICAIEETTAKTVVPTGAELAGELGALDTAPPGEGLQRAA